MTRKNMKGLTGRLRNSWGIGACAIAVFSLCLFAFTFAPEVTADGHGHRARHLERHHLSDSNQKRDDDGNEITGETAAWLFVAANLPAVFGMGTRRLVRGTALSENLKNRLKTFNNTQRKLLMPLHYVLNIAAIIIACIHYGLSCCRSSSLPEWGLGGMALLAVLGVLLKFKKSPAHLRKAVHALHTSPVSLGVLLGLLLVGHHLVD